MDDKTLPGRHHRPEPDDPTDDRWWAPTEHMPAVVGDQFEQHFPGSARHAKGDEVDKDEAAELIAAEARRSPIPESDTDAGWARLAGAVGVDIPAVA